MWKIKFIYGFFFCILENLLIPYYDLFVNMAILSFLRRKRNYINILK